MGLGKGTLRDFDLVVFLTKSTIYKKPNQKT